MRLLLVNVINLSKNIETLYPPLGLAYLASALKKHFKNIQIKIIDRDVERVIKTFCPDAVGVSAVSQNFGRAITIGNLCRSLKIPVFIGGVHMSLLPESLPGAFDFGVYGEGEGTIVEVIDFLSKGGISGSEEMGKIKGLILHYENGIRMTDIRPPIQNLDSIPFPDRDLLNIPIGQTAYLFTSRGCPYQCTFCASTRFWKNVRWFSAEYVIHEIEEVIKKYKPWALTFYDDLFIADFKRLEKIVELICAKGIHQKVRFSFSCRANIVNEKLIQVLKPLRIHTICMGLESGCQRILNYLKGGGMTIAQNKYAVDLFVKEKIRVNGTFVIGAPDETEEEIIQTLNFIKRSRLTNFAVYILTPFPGTPLWNMAEKRGLVSNNMDWGKLAIEVDNRLEDKIILSEKVPRKRLLELYNLFKLERRKRTILYVLKMGIKNSWWVFKKISYLLNRLQPIRK